MKVNPIVAWTDEEVETYIAEHDLIVNPLRLQGYDSIGCWPCTQAGKGREGRWAGQDKLECGLHPALAEPLMVSGSGLGPRENSREKRAEQA